MAPISERSGDSLGDLLRTARERRGLTVQDVAQITRIPRRHLDALERGQLDELPGGMYRRAEVRTYAETVGLDKALALERLERSLSPATDAAPDVAVATVGTLTSRGGLYAGVIAAGLIAAAAVTYWWWQQAAIRAESTHAPIQSTVTPALAPGAEVAAFATDAAPTSQPGEPPPPSPAADRGAPVAGPEPVDAPEVRAPMVDPVLTVTSSPPGARVLIDGIGYGPTPITVRHLRPGQKRVRLVLDGYVSVEQRLRLTPTRSATLDVTLERSR
jgi:cytoskeleton protein RodZ